MHRVLRGLVLCLPLVSIAAEPTGEFAQSFSLELSDEAPAYRIQLTPEMYAASLPSADLNDIVVVDADGMRMPLARMPRDAASGLPFERQARLLPVPATAGHGQTGTRIEADRDGALVIRRADSPDAPVPVREWLLDAGKPVRLDQVALVPGSGWADFDLRVAVDGSTDLEHWRTLTADAPLLSVQQGSERVDKLHIMLGGGVVRYLRLWLLSGAVPWEVAHPPQLQLTGHDADPDSAPMVLQYLAVEGAPISDGDASAMQWEYRLPGPLPLQSLRVILPDRLAAAHVVLTASHSMVDDARWDPLATVDAVRVDGLSHGDVHLTGRPLVRLRLRADTSMSQAPQLELAWRADEFVFLAQGNAPYRLLAGSWNARNGRYPVVAALEQLRKARGVDWQPPLARPGPQTVAAGGSALQAPTDWSRILLWLVLVAGALLVIGLATSLLRRR